MSDTDSFIEEVTEEVRRDRMFVILKRYGWIAVVVIIAIVGAAAYNEYRKASQTAAAEKLGDDIIASLAANDPAGRAVALSDVEPGTPGGAAILDFLTASALANSDQTDQAVTKLEAIATNGDLPRIYRDIATFKALTLQSDSLPAADRRLQFEALAQPGAPLRLLSEEQLALIDVAEGATEAALDRLQSIILDAETDTTLRQRASQLIVALGGTPETLPSFEQG
ncbi:hypothetical protein [Falsiphaeobacter marinintestinus]|uniref:hypothetical protein n=1 Tax=Falsiphaeobacter marinintestinus TaxID=1492905 RepID=UPI0011B5D386|nr:hypothetical protein [Phaeobacter marinintestinus]